MPRAHKPTPERLYKELSEKQPPGPHDPSVVQIGCIGCPNGNRFVASWLSIDQLVQIEDNLPEVPLTFIHGCFASISRAEACEVNEETNEPDCSHAEAIKTFPAVIGAIQQQ